jgi:hypothetical protein
MATEFSENSENNCNIFYCKLCDYKCFKKQFWVQHIKTQKHKIASGNAVAKNGNILETTRKHICVCGKHYEDRSGLWKHKKICSFKNSDADTDNHNDNNNNNHDNKDELIQYLISENKEFKNLILEVCKNFQGTNNSHNNNNNTNTINSHNKTFNLQFFLNETCKDAMNMSEFIDSMKLQLSDLESVGKLGFVDGISNIIIKNLEALDIQKRPVHCSDSKRETMYIKEHDKWEKDDTEMKQMKELVRTVRDRNITLIATWRDLYPECVKSNSKKTAQFNQICMEAFGGETGGNNGTKQEKEEKIISKIAKSVIIDKKE